MDVENSGKGVVLLMPRPASKRSKQGRKYNTDMAEHIKVFRRSRGLSQEELAERVGVTQYAISNYEMGKRRLPAEILLKLAQTFRVSVYALTNGKENPPPPKNGRRVRAIVEKIETLPPKKQQQVVDYIAFISQNGQRVAA